MSALIRLFMMLFVLSILMVWLAGRSSTDSDSQTSNASVSLVGTIENAPFAAAVPLRQAVFSPDGRWLAGTGRGEVRLWDAATGRFVRRIKFGDSAVGCVLAFTPNGKSVLVLAFEDVPYVPAPPYHGRQWPITVRRFDAATGAELGRVPLSGENAAALHGQPVAAFTADGSGVIIGGDS